MTPTAPSILAEPKETGALGVFQLKRLWSRAMATRQGKTVGGLPESHLDSLVIHALGLGLEPTVKHLYRSGPSFEEFEKWIVATAGPVSREQLGRINAAVAGTEYPPEIRRQLEAVESAPPVLSEADLAFWEEQGYVILHDAVPKEALAATQQAIWDFLGAKPEDPGSWYPANDHGIMVQLFQHPALASNRRSTRIHKAFAQLWKTADLWVSTDRVGFNPPIRPGWKYPAEDLHWDVSLHLPIPFGTQGILYLTDTLPHQGALTCVPGFHRHLAEWLQGLPHGADPRQQNLHALGSRHIGGQAGDLVIWNQALPHGASPNRETRPRMVHYINMYPTRIEEQPIWL